MQSTCQITLTDSKINLRDSPTRRAKYVNYNQINFMSNYSQKYRLQADLIARLFSSSVIKELARKGKSSIFTQLLHESGILQDNPNIKTVRDVFENAMKHLKQQDNRYECVYKAAITKKILLGRHSLKTTSMLTEFRTGHCKADIVILNGTGIVYEIKSERDSLTRLAKQLNDYKRVFGSVNVIMGENHLDDKSINIPDGIGILKLSPTYQLSIVRKCVDRPEKTHTDAIFNAINIKESEAVLRYFNIEIPDVPNTQKYTFIRKLFTMLKPEKAHAGMVHILKKTRSLYPLKTLLDELPESLHAVSLSTKIRKRDHKRLIDALQTPIHQTIYWR